MFVESSIVFLTQVSAITGDEGGGIGERGAEGSGDAGRYGRMRYTSEVDLEARGQRVRREVLGDEHVDRAIANTTEFTAPFQDLISRYAWGEVWARPGLSRAERSIIALTALAVLRQDEELAMHVRAAVRNGLTQAQIREVLLQVAVYAGVPAGNRAFAIAQRVLAELDASGR